MKKVVSATLAGALAVGMVPAMALADDSVELQTAVEATDFAAGKITAAADDEGTAIDLAKSVVLSMDADGAYVVPAQVTTKSGTVIDLTDAETALDYKVSYYKVSTDPSATVKNWSGTDKVESFVKSTEDPAKATWTAGSYYVIVWGEGMTSSDAVAVKFTVTSAALSGLNIYQKGAVATDVSDVEFAYKGSAYNATNLGIALDGTVFTAAEIQGFIKDGENTATATPVAGITYVGKYWAKVVGTAGEYAGTVTWLPVEITPYDLSKDANLGIMDLPKTFDVAANLDYSELVGLDMDGHLGGISVTVDGIVNGKGLYDATIAVKEGYAAEGNAINSKDVQFKIVDTVLDTNRFYMGGNVIDGSAAINIDLSVKSQAKNVFDIDAVEVLLPGVVWNDSLLSTQVLPESAYDIVVTDAKGNVVDDAKVATAGHWFVTVKVADDSCMYGGASETVEYVVSNGTLTLAEDAFVKFEGKTVNAIETVYDGNDVVADIETVVIDGKNTLVAGVDYTVKYQQEITDKYGVTKWVDVEKIVDAGTYQMILSSDTYAITDDAEKIVPITVKALKVYPVIADELSGEAGYDMLYKGVALNPVVKFQAKNDKGVLVDLPANIAVAETDYAVEITKFVDQVTKEEAKVDPKEFVEAGDYTFTIKDGKGGNFEVLADGTKLTSLVGIELTVDGRDVFVDVESGKWFAQPVYEMADAGIIGGYGNGKFGPYDNCDREDYALMVARMLEGVPRLGDSLLGEILKPDGTTGGILNNEVITPFADVDGKAYYAAAVKYVYENGIMGQNVGKIFGVNADITREEAITVLYRLDEAGLYGDAILTASALDAYADGDEVSKWAVEAMEWAVENGLMGVNTTALNPGDPISRAEIAAILARYMDLRKMA